MAWTSMIVEHGRCLTGLGPYPIEQDAEKWAVTGEYRTAVLEVNAPCVSGCTLYIEGCEMFGGQWTQVAAMTQGGRFRHFLRRTAPMGSPERLPKYIRWRLDSTSGAWSTTFLITLNLKD